jgi:hypothetical protein
LRLLSFSWFLLSVYHVFVVRQSLFRGDFRVKFCMVVCKILHTTLPYNPGLYPLPVSKRPPYFASEHPFRAGIQPTYTRPPKIAHRAISGRSAHMSAHAIQPRGKGMSPRRGEGLRKTQTLCHAARVLTVSSPLATKTVGNSAAARCPANLVNLDNVEFSSTKVVAKSRRKGYKQSLPPFVCHMVYEGRKGSRYYSTPFLHR